MNWATPSVPVTHVGRTQLRRAHRRRGSDHSYPRRTDVITVVRIVLAGGTPTRVGRTAWTAATAPATPGHSYTRRKDLMLVRLAMLGIGPLLHA